VTGQPRAFVLEIGTEELPPRDVLEATEQVKNKVLSSPYKKIFDLHTSNMVTLLQKKKRICWFRFIVK
jgi:glycyl-tRNA synthetase beta subunit